MRKKLIFLIPVYVISILFTFNLGIFAQGQMIMRVGGISSPEEPSSLANKFFCDLINDATKGEIKAESYIAQQLGSGTDQIENMQVGLQECFISSIDWLATYCKDLNILAMAFAFKDLEHVYKFLESPLAEESIFKKLREDYNIRVLTYKLERLPRAIFFKKPVFRPEDMTGIKFRVADIPIFVKNFDQLGAVPIRISWQEYPLALLQGVVEGGESALENIYPQRFYEGAPYITMVDYAFPLECITIREDFYEKLSQEHKDLIQLAANKSAEYFANHVYSHWEKQRELILQGGGVFISVDKEPFIKKMAPLADQLEKEEFWETKGLYQKVQEIAD